MKTFTQAVEEFIANNTWLGVDHAIAIATLFHTANELDAQVLNGKINPPLLTAFGLAYRNLLKERPVGGDEEDELAKLLRKKREEA